MSLFESIILIIAMAVVTLIITRRLRLPAIIGYLFLGVVVGPFGLNLIEGNHEIDLLAEFGIVFLLFAIGLEISLTQIIRMRRSVLFVGGLQVLICMTVPAVTAYFLGMSLGTGFVAAAALSLSSTAIVVKQLAEQKELLSQHGEMSLSILLFQDLAAIPFLIIIPVLAGATGSIAGDLGWALVKGLAVIGGVLLAGRFILRPLFDEVARADSEELFMLTSLLVALGTAWLSHAMGLSMVLGAFLAGLVLGESHHRHQIKNYIHPFRDLLLGLFFITVGMLLDFNMVLRYWYWVLFLVVSIVLFKFILITWVTDFFGHLKKLEAMRTGLILAHGGEFGFVLLALAINLDVMEADYGQVVLAGVLITMFISPLLIYFNGPIAEKFNRLLPG